MALNEIFRDADSLSVAADETVKSGNLVAFNSGLAGVAETDAKDNEAEDGYVATVRFVGVFKVPAGSASAPAVGKSVFITPPAAGPAAPVTLAATGTKIGTIHSVRPDGSLFVILNK